MPYLELWSMYEVFSQGILRLEHICQHFSTFQGVMYSGAFQSVIFFKYKSKE